jgi:hypothetical protein
MNELMSLPPVSPSDGMTLPERADRIRHLVPLVKASMLEIGYQLVMAKTELSHGDWLFWLDREFNWKDRTAQYYMRIARAFKSAKIADLETINEIKGLTIDAQAFSVLSASEVAQGTRDEAIVRAKAGEHITKDVAKQMVTEAREAAVRETLEQYQAERDKELKAAIRNATQQLRSDNDELETELARLQREYKRPNIATIITMLQRTLKVPRLSREHCHLLAQMLNVAITVNGENYLPISKEEQRQRDVMLGITSDIDRAIRTLASAPDAMDILTACYPVQRHTIRDHIENAGQWIARCKRALNKFDPNEKV